MNGRVYDPDAGRFMSADPFVSNPYGTQGFSRYGYVSNNPLKYTDPSGFIPDDGNRGEPGGGGGNDKDDSSSNDTSTPPELGTDFGPNTDNFGAHPAGTYSGGVDRGGDGGTPTTPTPEPAKPAVSDLGIHYGPNTSNFGYDAYGAYVGGVDVADRTARALEIKARVEKRGYFISKAEADELYQNNMNPNMRVEVDASKHHFVKTGAGNS